MSLGLCAAFSVFLLCIVHVFLCLKQGQASSLAYCHHPLKSPEAFLHPLLCAKYCFAGQIVKNLHVISSLGLIKSRIKYLCQAIFAKVSKDSGCSQIRTSKFMLHLGQEMRSDSLPGV